MAMTTLSDSMRLESNGRERLTSALLKVKIRYNPESLEKQSRMADGQLPVSASIPVPQLPVKAPRISFVGNFHPAGSRA